RILQFLRRGRAYDDVGGGDDDTTVNHSNSVVDVISCSENQQQQELHESVNEQHSLQLFNDSSFLVPLVLTSTGFVVIAVALWIYLRRR
ncbi:unnamed protein product, partial [Trichobilharzia regenti]